MGSILGACIGSMCAGCCCSACKECGQAQSGPISRIPYLFLFLLSGIFAILMSLYGENELDLHFYSVKLCNTSSCSGNGSVYRVTFVLFLFELIHVIIIGCGAIQFHYLWFAIKFIIYCCFITLFFFLNNSSTNSFFNDYGEACRYISFIYLVLQILVLISYSYDIKDNLLKKSDLEREKNQDLDSDGKKTTKYDWLLLILSFSFYIIAFTFLGLFFNWYTDSHNSLCSLHNTLISITIVFVILNFLLSVLRADGSFFTSSIVSLYCTYLVFAAIQADDNETCNKWNNNRDTISLWIGVIITLISLCYAGLKSDSLGLLFNNHENSDSPLLDNEKNKKDYTNNIEDPIDYNTKNKKKQNENDIDEDDNDDDDDNNNNNNNKNSNSISTSNKTEYIKRDSRQTLYFHIIMMLASCYMCMLFTNWGTNHSNISTTGKVSLWVNMGSQWITQFLFYWLLAAPLICPARFNRNPSE